MSDKMHPRPRTANPLAKRLCAESPMRLEGHLAERALQGFPVFNRKLTHPAELRIILGNESEPQRARVGCNQQVVRADRRSSSLQVDANAGVVFVCGRLHGEHRDSLERAFDGQSESFGAAYRCPESQFAGDHDPRADAIIPKLGESTGAGASRLFQELRMTLL